MRVMLRWAVVSRRSMAAVHGYASVVRWLRYSRRCMARRRRWHA